VLAAIRSVPASMVVRELIDAAHEGMGKRRQIAATERSGKLHGDHVPDPDD
jgi:hypothetical protein